MEQQLIAELANAYQALQDLEIQPKIKNLDILQTVASTLRNSYAYIQGHLPAPSDEKTVTEETTDNEGEEQA